MVGSIKEGDRFHVIHAKVSTGLKYNHLHSARYFIIMAAVSLTHTKMLSVQNLSAMQLEY